MYLEVMKAVWTPLKYLFHVALNVDGIIIGTEIFWCHVHVGFQIWTVRNESTFATIKNKETTVEESNQRKKENQSRYLLTRINYCDQCMSLKIQRVSCPGSFSSKLLMFRIL